MTENVKAINAANQLGRRSGYKPGLRAYDSLNLSATVLDALRLCEANANYRDGGKVYLILVDHRFVKIGYTKNDDAQKRFAALQTSTPFRLILLSVFYGGKFLEESLHALFNEYHERNEWFRVEGELGYSDLSVLNDHN